MAQNHLLKRGNRFFFRRRVPQELRGIIGRDEIKKALGTSDRKEAGRLATIETLRSDELFAIKRKEVQLVAPPESRRRIGYNDALLLVAGWYRELEESSEDWLEENLEIFQNPDELREAMETAHLDEFVFSGGGDLGMGRRYAVENGRGTFRRILTENGCDFTGTDEEFRRLSALVRKSFLENARNEIKRLNREPLGNPLQIDSVGRREDFHAPFQKPSIGQSYSATVGEVLKEFIEDRHAKEVTDATIRTYKGPIRLLREVLGEKTRIESIDRDCMKRVREVILSLPANATKFYRGKSLLESIKLAKEEGRATIESKTAENYFGAIQAIFHFATRIRKIPFNPCLDVFSVGGANRSRKKRAIFKIDELNKAFSSLHYTKAKKRDRERQPGRFWVPLLALFQGMRSNEICQLYSDDLIQKHGIWCIEIRETRHDGTACEKKLKTATSERCIPVHPELIGIGFIDFVLQRQSDTKSPRLFPDLNLGKNGYYSDPFQKWFGRFLVEVFGLGAKPQATLHSFRHMWKDALTEAQVPEIIAKRLGGWSGDTSAASGYGHGPSPKTLFEALEKVEFPGLNLAHLRAS